MVMGVGGCILKGDEDKGDLHIRSVLLDTLADAVSVAAIAFTGFTIPVTKRFFWFDSVVAITISIAIGYQALLLLRDVRRDLK